MESDHVEFKLEDSVSRINDIIMASDLTYEERKIIPSRNELTYTNGFYVLCSAIFVDIRESSDLTDFHRTKVLAKLYRAYISEVAAVMNGNVKCAEINVIGDCVSGIFDSPYKEDIDSVFSTSAMISSIIDIMNYRFKKNNMKEISVGIGMAYGRALMVKAGYKGSGISEVIWMGDVVNEASKLASYGNKESYDRETMVSSSIYTNLKESNQKLLELNLIRNCYHGDVINAAMNNWYKTNCPP
jgi:class 3 adenylate cyclase